MKFTMADLQGNYRKGGEFGSSFGIGEIVLAVFDLSKPVTKEGRRTAKVEDGVRAKVVGVHFIAAKVMYDLAIALPEGEFYDAIPVEGVDSIFICELPRLRAVEEETA